MNLNRVILSWPTLLSAPASESGDTARRSWIQVARTGSFTSKRYGSFAITRADLVQMLTNFNDVTPTLVYEKRDFVIEVETDQGQPLSKRFKHEVQAVAYAESLRDQLDPKKWTLVPVPARKLHGQR